MSGIIAVTERKNLWVVWRDNFLWTASHHLVGAAIAACYNLENQYFGWEAVVLTIPVIYFVYRSYSLHLGRLEAAKQHTQDIGDLHWRAIEALALAIDAKDETTHNHLLRVKVYATEIGRELNMSDDEMQALQAAALLHDVGKLAVPEYIISKPGKLTREEFEKMKIHPVVGAEILDRVRFPYPVVPIVRSHHEKFDGTGYPNGLSGEDIPLGARILAAVDCLDALASDRQYRRALPLDKAMEIVAGESGTAFDPKVVAILQRRYKELEKMATSMPRPQEAQLSKNIKIVRGSAPGAGYAETEDTIPAKKDQVDVILTVESAIRELRGLLSISEEFGGALSIEETLGNSGYPPEARGPLRHRCCFLRAESRVDGEVCLRGGRRYLRRDGNPLRSRAFRLGSGEPQTDCERQPRRRIRLWWRSAEVCAVDTVGSGGSIVRSVNALPRLRRTHSAPKICT